MGDIGAGEGAASLSGLIGLLIHLGVVVAMVVWGRRVARARGGRAWQVASYMPIAGIVVSMLGLLGTVIGLVRAFGAVASVPASERALALSDGIAVAMWSTAIGLGAAVTLYVVSFFAFLYGTYAPKR